MMNEYQLHPKGILFSAGIAILTLLFMTGCMSEVMYRQRSNVPPPPVNESYNFDELNNYGEWIYVEPYGNVWRPFVDLDWRPFYYGHWDYSDAGWTWISYEPFGWIVYHYGNWADTRDYRWVWIPSYGDWSPARVEWMEYGDYICWAPLPVRGIAWPHPWERRDVDVWTVVRMNDFTADNVGTRSIDNRIVQAEPYRGEIITRRPDRRMIEERTGIEVRPIKIDREKVIRGKREFGRMRVPDAEKARVEKYRPDVEKQVIKHPPERREGERRGNEKR